MVDHRHISVYSRWGSRDPEKGGNVTKKLNPKRATRGSWVTTDSNSGRPAERTSSGRGREVTALRNAAPSTPARAATAEVPRWSRKGAHRGVAAGDRQQHPARGRPAPPPRTPPPLGRAAVRGREQGAGDGTPSTRRSPAAAPPPGPACRSGSASRPPGPQRSRRQSRTAPRTRRSPGAEPDGGAGLVPGRRSGGSFRQYGAGPGGPRAPRSLTGRGDGGPARPTKLEQVGRRGAGGATPAVRAGGAGRGGPGRGEPAAEGRAPLPCAARCGPPPAHGPPRLAPPPTRRPTPARKPATPPPSVPGSPRPSPPPARLAPPPRAPNPLARPVPRAPGPPSARSQLHGSPRAPPPQTRLRARPPAPGPPRLAPPPRAPNPSSRPAPPRTATPNPHPPSRPAPAARQARPLRTPPPPPSIPGSPRPPLLRAPWSPPAPLSRFGRGRRRGRPVPAGAWRRPSLAQAQLGPGGALVAVGRSVEGAVRTPASLLIRRSRARSAIVGAEERRYPRGTG
nr:basic proline-rich protein-like [Equus asinus]